MPVLIRLLLALVIGVALGAVVTPVLWAPLLRQANHLLSPFLVLSLVILAVALVRVWQQFRQP